MTLSWIADANVCTTNAEVAEVIAAHTCTNCGYVYGWPDPYNPLLVWTVAVCPADSVIPTMNAIIANAVNVRYNNSDTVADPHTRAEQIIVGVKSDVNAWLYEHTTQGIADYLSQDAKMQSAILAAMATAGAINLVNVTS
jgi:hypothetical protein